MRRRQGFSLIEILVVLVVLLVGILSVIRIFPLGFAALSNTRDYTMAQVLARGEIDKLASLAQDLPQQILPVRYVYVNNGGWQLLIQAFPDTDPRDLGPGGELREDGSIFIPNPGGGAGTLIPWRYYNDANRVRRIIGEGGTIPAPRPVGTEFGGLRSLNFAPIVDDINLLLVYSADMEGEGESGTTSGQVMENPDPWEFHHDDEMGQVWLPGFAGRPISYKLNFSYWINNAGQLRKIDIIDLVVTVTPTPAGGNPRERLYNAATNEVAPFDLRLLAGGGANWAGVVPDSVSANRLFDRLAIAAMFKPDYPYEYKVLHGNLGGVLFNPLAYNFRERRGRPRDTRPLTAQINYDVYNWHIISDDFRADRARSPIHKLSLQRIKAAGDILNDRRRYNGLGFPVPLGGGQFDTQRAVVVLDLDSGGIVSPQADPGNAAAGLSYKVDYLRGVIAMGADSLPGPGNPGDLAQSITIIMPDANQTVVTNIQPSGRNFRVLYEADNDWAVQVFKAPQTINVIGALPLGIAQAYVGNSTTGVGLPTRIYFPLADNGTKVSIREVWYRDTNGNLKALRDHDFLLRLRALDSAGQPLPSIDIREIDPQASAFDFQTYGYAVRGIGGSSLRARVIWNTADKEDVRGNSVGQIQERMDLHDVWSRQWRKVEVESFLTRRDEN
ncbi:MAG: prepilin-type N-terminal cleavage/methylation domain-containing protein [Fimbriimonadales bacterium]